MDCSPEATMSSDKEKNEKAAAIPTVCLDDSTSSSKTKRGKCAINKKMLPFKLYYFLDAAAAGMILPFLTVFAKTRMGLTATSLSAIYMSQLIVIVVCKPCIGLLVDHFNKLKSFIIVLAFLNALFLFLLLPIPKINPPGSDTRYDLSNYSINCTLPPMVRISNLNDNEAALLQQMFKDSNCSEQIQASLCDNHKDWLPPHITEPERYSYSLCISNESSTTLCPSCLHTFNPSVLRNCEFLHVCQKDISESVDDRHLFRSYEFWLFSLFLILSFVASHCELTLFDTACYESLKNSGSNYGRQRFWAAIGWGLSSPIAGYLTDYTEDYLCTWILMGVFTAISILIMVRLDLAKTHVSQNILKDTKKVFHSQKFISFEIGVFMCGVYHGVIFYYLVWYLEVIGGTKFLFGLVGAVQCFIGEVPFMFYSNWILKKMGHFHVLSLIFIVYFVRFLAYSYIDNPWYTLPIESLHGITYGLLCTTMTSFANISARPGIEATTQSILSTTYESIGSGIGCLIAGFGFDYLGIKGTFFWLSMSGVISFMISIFNTIRLNSRGSSFDVKASSTK